MVSNVIKCYLILLLGFANAANVLFVVPFTSKSHYITLRPIGLELARRGHNVTIITAIREADPPPNYRQVMVDDKEIWDVLGFSRPNVFTMVDVSAEKFHEVILWGGGFAFTEVVFNSTQVQKFLAEDQKFDVVICEHFFQESTYVLAHKYQAPLVLATTYGNSMRLNIATRNPLQLNTILSEFLDVKDPRSFWGRLRNVYFTVYEYLWWRYWFLEKHERLVKKYLPNLPQPVPSLYEIQQNTSLILINTHFSFDPPAAYLPNIVEVGGLHLTKSDGSMPKDFQKILDEAKDGVVYVNFGSNVRSSELPDEKLNAFLTVFRELKQTVLWKWEEDNMENKPKNLVIRKWMPQKEILSHPNIKVFISHGGMIGTQEAMFHGVPIVGIPIYADQYNNLLRTEELGFGKILIYQTINENTLRNALNQVLNDVSYRNNAKELSARFKDRPLSALDTAMFWIEYVIRHKGADFMKNPVRNINCIEYYMLDVIGFILLLVCVPLYVIVKFMLILYRIFSAKNVKIEKKKKH